MNQGNDCFNKKCGYSSASCCGYLVGVPGPTGPAGGPIGPTGPQGIQGIQGIAGIND